MVFSNVDGRHFVEETGGRIQVPTASKKLHTLRPTLLPGDSIRDPRLNPVGGHLSNQGLP